MDIAVCVAIISILIIYVCKDTRSHLAKDTRSHIEKIDAMLLDENIPICHKSSVRDL